jgi:uncharacterized protein YukE
MSNRIEIDTARLLDASNRLKDINNKIDADFETLETAIKHLNREWNSEASGVVINYFFNRKDNLKNSRYKALESCSNFLNQQVSDGYNSNETTVISLADAFK